RRAPHSPTLFPYTTLFRSVGEVGELFGTMAAAVDRRNEDHSHLSLCGDDPGIVAGTREHGCAREPEIVGHFGDCGSDRLMQRNRDRKSTRLNSSHVKISYA